MQEQRLLADLTDPLTDTGPGDQIGCDSRIVTFGEIPGGNLATPDVYHKVDGQLYTPQVVGR